MENESYYKNKALKYKMKYLLLKQKMFGGAKPEWFDKFNQELIDFFPSDDIYILSGSGALVTLLNYFNKFDLLDNTPLDIPGDFDIIYVSDQSFLSPKNSFGQGKFTKVNPFSLTSSPIFEYKLPKLSDPNYSNLKSIYDTTLIKKMDLTRISDMSIDYICVKNPDQQELFKIVSPTTLLELYDDNPNPKNANKIKILKELIEYLKEQRIIFPVITVNPKKYKNEKLPLPSVANIPAPAASAADAAAQPSRSTLSFHNVESPARPARPSFRKPMPSIDTDSDDESPNKKPKGKKSLFDDDD
jgi:hypothetical protein